jgi:hypothetical protein
MIFPPTFSGYSPLQGYLTRYSPSYPLTTFIQPSPTPSPNYAILLGGLSDSLLPCPYTAKLGEMCKEVGYNFVNPVMRSSGLQFGFCSLDSDAEDLTDLVRYLKTLTSLNCPADVATNVVMIGHSTGCQDIVHFLRTVADKDVTNCVSGAVLQASCSDREGEEDNSANVGKASRMIEEGRGGEFMDRNAFWAPITAERYMSLYGLKGSGDSYFCSDLSAEELEGRIGHMKSLQFCVCAYSGADEYVPKRINKEELVDRLCKAGGMHKLILEGANHNLSLPEDGSGSGSGVIARFVEEVKGRIEGLRG